MEDDEIAIVGAGCRFPGADNLDEFWKVLVNGENHVREIPESRWNNSAFYDEDPNAPGKSYVKKAGLLKDHDKFDHRLFGISEVEATRMDPQQRYVLECVHMAMEDGGFTRKQLNGSNTGVIIGCMNADYGGMANYDLTDVGGYNATGSSVSVISARVSYVYNLHGTCLTLDTACSSALIAIHLASQAIKSGDCDMMICGGVNSILSPDTYIPLCRARMMSATGQCQSFCETADGYARGEGCGIVILKSLKAARQDGNKIWATIKTGSNQDGCTTKPITAPSGEQQLKLLKQVYEKFQFGPSEIQYIEAHGTGTPRGDPTELNALGEFFSSTREEFSGTILVGSVKSNIGHTESAAGIAGLLKILLMMNHGKFVPSLHIKPDKSNVNQKIKLREYGLDIPTSVQQWSCNQNDERHACLNSFGFGGSNTHAIISMSENYLSKPDIVEVDQRLPICISGTDQEALKRNLLQFHDDLDQIDFIHPDLAMVSLQHRDIFPYRTLIYGKDKSEIQRECKLKVGSVSGISPKRKHNKVFVYCGVGTTWTGMCAELMKNSEVFRGKVAEIDKFLKPIAGFKIGKKFMTETNYDDPFLNHIAIFCAQVALTEVWKSHGIVPDKIVGQSVGEVAAAYTSQCLTLEEAVNVIHYRSLILSNQTNGSMVVVGNIDINYVEEMCRKFENKINIAVYSSPTACTLSGSKDDLKLFVENLKNEGKYKDLFVRELKVKCAYHSPFLEDCMDDIRTRIDGVLAGTTPRKYQMTLSPPMLSTVTGKTALADEIRTGKYWSMNIRQPVKFMQSIKQAYEHNMYNIYLELGPRPVLKAHIPSIFGSNHNFLTIPSINVKKEIATLNTSLTNLFESGVDVCNFWFHKNRVAERIRIPRYVFNKTGRLFISNKYKNHMKGSSTYNHTHLYVQTSENDNETAFKILLDEKSTPFIFEHFLSDNLIVPGATYVEAGFHIGLELLKVPANLISIEFDFLKTFTPVKGRQSEILVDIKSSIEKGSVDLILKSSEYDLAMGSISLREKPERHNVDIDYIRSFCTNHRSKKQCYDALGQFNFRYGESLSLIEQAWISESGTQCLAEIRIPNTLDTDLIRTHFHPCVIDSIFQMFGIVVGESLKHAFAVPKGVESIALNRPLIKTMFGYAEEIAKTDHSTHYNAILVTTNGTIIAEIENFYTRIITKESKVEDNTAEYKIEWSEIEIPPETKSEITDITLLSADPEKRWVFELKESINVTVRQFDEYWIYINEKNRNGDTEEESSLILYHASRETEKRNSKGIFDYALQRFLDMQKLLISKVQTSNNLQMIIITENTQACLGRNHVHCEGSELWGMIRAAMHEGFFGKVRLIDIDPDNLDISVLKRLILSQNAQIEHVIQGSKVFQTRVTSVTVGKHSRTISVNPTDILSVHSVSPTNISKPYLFIHDKVKTDFDSVSVCVDSFAVHEKSLYIPVIGDAKTSDNILQNDKNSQIIMLEGRGKIQDTQKEVVFIYPVKAMTTVNIPRQYIFELENCPFYRPGILVLINTLVHVSFAVEPGQNVAVLKQCDDGDMGELMFKSLMQKRKCKLSFLTKDSLQKGESKFEEETLILSTYLPACKWSLIMESFPNLKRLITLTHLISEPILQQFKHSFSHINVETVLTSDIMSGRRIFEAIPLIKSCMQDQDLLRNFHMLNVNRFVLNIPMEKFELRSQIESGSLKCFINAEKLFRSNASYIIVGGLSGLGWELLQLMAVMGARVLITFSRRAPSDILRENIVFIENQYNCRIFALQVDICELKSIEKAFTKIDSVFPNHPVRGIFHGAGVISDSLLQTMDKDKIIKVVKPKIQGAWNLHLSSLNIPLDYFVIHSSIVSVLGNPGQCNYAAANSFLDSFALYRRSLGLPGQSINWGALEVGMAAETDELKSKLKEKGFNLVKKERLRSHFIQTLVRDTTGIVYADIEWDKLLSSLTFAKQITKYARFRKVKTTPKISSSNDKVQFNFDDLNNLDGVKKEELVKRVLKDIVQLVLVMEENTLKDDTRLTDIGIDSMAAMSLSNAMDETFGFREPVVTLLSEATTISTISSNIIQSINNPQSKHRKPNMHSENVSKFNQLFESKDLTFMQNDLLESYKLERNDPFYVTVIDIEVTDNSLSLSDWKLILNHAMKLNPEFRKRYLISEEGDVTAETISEADSPLNIKEISIEEFEQTQDYDVREKTAFDIHNSLPISIEVATSPNKKMVRLTMHKVAFDMKGFTIFCTDLEKSYESVVNQLELPRGRPFIDVVTAVKDAILPRMDELHSYWKSYLDCDINPVTFSSRLREPNLKFCRIENLNISPDLRLRIKDYISKHGITLYEFLMSIYQLYLYIGSGSTLLTVGTAADMRFHVPELNNILTRCVNYIPTIARINEDGTITKFIKNNSAHLSNTTEHGAYPSSLIQNNVKAAGMKNDLYRHVLSMNDLTGIRGVSKTKSMFKIRRILHSKPTRETFINVQTDYKNNWLNLELGYNSEICGTFGTYFSKILLTLMHIALDNSKESIKEIRDKMIVDLRDVAVTLGSLKTKEVCNDQELSQQQKTDEDPVMQNKEPILKEEMGYQLKNNRIVNRAIDVERNKKLQTILTKERKDDVVSEIQNILIAGQFNKQTSNGWDHKVDVKLFTDAEDRLVLEWGKDRRIRKRISRAFDMSNTQEIFLRKINGLHSLIIISNEKKIVLKTPDRNQAEQWLNHIQRMLNSTGKIQ